MSDVDSVGALVIGQSPRLDVEAELREVLGEEVRIDLRGALDRLGRSEIDQLTPSCDADALFTHLPSGDDVTISKAAVVRHGESTLAEMTGAGHRAVIVMCTGAFPTWMANYPCIFPSRVLDGFVEALAGGGRLGVLVPLVEQIEPMRERWKIRGFEADTVCLRPTAGAAEAEAAAQQVAVNQPDLIVYDCLSYSISTKRRVEAVCGIPGVLAVSAAARAAAELLSGGA